MADVPGKFYRATKVRTGVAPSSAGSIEGEVLPPVNPPGSSLNSVGLTMPSAFTVSNSPLTANGTIGVAGAGTVAQYIRGDGSLADFPESSGGGSSVSYYLNGSVDQGTIGGIAYKELSKVPILGAGTDFTINADGYIASFITDAGDPNLLEIPGGNWNFETYFSASSSGGTPTFYVELYKVSGTTATLIASSSSAPELIAFGTNLTPYFSSLAVPTTTLALTDRLAVRYYVTHSGRTITLHTENNHLCQIITTFTTGLTALNGLTAQVQNFAVGTSGTDFNIASAVSTHTFNLPTASATNRGALSSADWSLFTQAYNDKINSAAVTGTTTKTLTLTQQDGGTITASWSDLNTDAVLSVFGRTGAVVAANGDYTTAQVTESGNLYYTEARVNANANVAANTAARHNAVTIGTANGLSLSTQVLSLGLASAGVTGALSGSDWSTFNTKQNALTLTTTGTSGAATLVGATLNIPNYGSALSDYLPLTGGTLTGPLSVTGNVTLIAGGVGSSFNRQISLGSGTAYNYQVRANGDDFQLIEAGSHVFLEYDYGGSLGAGTIRLYNNTVSTASFTGSSFIRTGGTSSQYLMADGSVSTLTNPITGSGNSGTIPVFTGSTTIGNSIIQSNSTQVNIVGNGSQLLFDSLGSTKDGGIQYINSFQLLIFNSRGTGSSINLGDTNLDFNTNVSGNPRLRITSGGNLLVGTTSDNGARLQVSGTSTFSDTVTFNGSNNVIRSGNELRFNRTDNLIYTRLYDAGSTFALDNRNGNGFSFQSAGTNQFVISSTGAATFSSSVTATQMAVGNTSFNGVLSVVGNGATNGLTVKSAGNVGTFPFRVTWSGGTDGSMFCVNDNGNVLINTVSDNGARLQVNGTGNFVATNNPLILRSTHATTMWTEYYYNTSTISGYIGSGTGLLSDANASDFIVRSEADFVVATSGNNRRLTISSTGAATFSSSVTANKFFVNTSGQSREISTFYGAGSLGQNIWIGGGGLNSTTGGGASGLGSNNTSLGVFALEDNTTGYRNTAVGYLALGDNTTGSSNTAVGEFSLYLNTSGYINSAFGGGSLAKNTTGYGNAGFGTDSLGNITTGDRNTGIGLGSGEYINSGAENNTSRFSTYIGYDTRASADGNTNEIVIGSEARGQGSNSAVIGNASITKTILRGNVLIGTITDTGARLNVGGSYQAYPVSIEAMAGGGQLALTRSGAVTEFYMGGSTGGGTQLYVRSGGIGGVRLDAGATSWVSASDIRLKDVTKIIDNAVESLSSIQTIYYSWKDSKDKKLHIGLIAQEVERVYPEIVSESKIDGMKGVNYTELIPVLIASIKELKQEIDTLKN